MNIGVVIPHLNDERWLRKTVANLLHTAGTGSIRISVCDDGSDIRPAEFQHPLVNCSFHPQRQGCAPARMTAARALGEWPDVLVITDSHMVFPPDWPQIINAYVNSRPSNTLWCSTYEHADETATGLQAGDHAVGGSRLFCFEEDDRGIRLLDHDLTPEPAVPNWHYRTSCPVGACYVIHRTQFEQLHGLTGLTGWGGDEPLLALKTWLTGGECRVMRDLRTVHVTQRQTAGRTPRETILANKLAIASIVMPPEPRAAFFALARRHSGPELWTAASEDIRRRSETLTDECVNLNDLRTRHFDDVCTLLDMEHPVESLVLQQTRAIR